MYFQDASQFETIYSRGLISRVVDVRAVCELFASEVITSYSSEFVIYHVVRHDKVNGRRIQLGSIVGLVTVEGF